MNAFVPGLGHLYVGKAQRAIVLLIGIEALCIALGQYGIFGSYLGFMLFYALHVVWIWLIFDSYRIAKENPQFPKKKYRNPVYYALYTIAFLATSSVLAEYRAQIYGFDLIAMPDDSMAPTMVKDDLVLIDTKAYRQIDPKPGDAVLIQDSSGRTIRRIKSVDYESVELFADDPNTLQGSGSVGLSSIVGQASAIVFSVRVFWWI